jgi:hypothetical protein
MLLARVVGCGKNEGNGKDEVFGGRKTKRVLEILKRPPLGGGKYKIYFSGTTTDPSTVRQLVNTTGSPFWGHYNYALLL